MNSKKAIRVGYIIGNVLIYLLAFYAFLLPLFLEEVFMDLVAMSTVFGLLLILIGIIDSYKIQKWIREGRL